MSTTRYSLNRHMQAAIYALEISREDFPVVYSIYDNILRGMRRFGFEGDRGTHYDAAMVGRYYGELLRKNGLGTTRWEEEIQAVRRLMDLEREAKEGPPPPPISGVADVEVELDGDVPRPLAKYLARSLLLRNDQLRDFKDDLAADVERLADRFVTALTRLEAEERSGAADVEVEVCVLPEPDDGVPHALTKELARALLDQLRDRQDELAAYVERLTGRLVGR